MLFRNSLAAKKSLGSTGLGLCLTAIEAAFVLFCYSPSACYSLRRNWREPACKRVCVYDKMSPSTITPIGDAMQSVGSNVIKVRFGGDIRKVRAHVVLILKRTLSTLQFPLMKEELTMGELRSTMERIFKGKISANDTLLYKYRDEGSVPLRSRVKTC